MKKSSKFISALKWFFDSMLWVFVLIVVLDVVTKQIAQNQLIYEGHSVTAIPGFLSFTLTYNNGAGFGIFGNINNEILRRTLLIGISTIMCILFALYYGIKFKKLSIAYKIGIMLLLAGAFGNWIDRTCYPGGLVIDFIDVDIGNYKTFPIFNLADSSLTIGIIYLIIVIIVDEIKNGKKEKSTLKNEEQSLNDSIKDKKDENKN